jgi:hypothetical protein
VLAVGRRAAWTAFFATIKLGEDFIIKLPEFFKPIFTEGRPITKDTGRALASWAKGSAPAAVEDATTEDETARILREQLEAAAALGTAALRAAWKTVPQALKPELTATKERLKTVASTVEVTSASN